MAEEHVICPVCHGRGQTPVVGVTAACSLCNGSGTVLVDFSQTEPVPWHEHRWHIDGISGRWACADCWADGGDGQIVRVDQLPRTAANSFREDEA